MTGRFPPPDDSAPTLAPTSLPDFGRYRLIRELGAGGMGRVYLAYDEDLREQVALKVIRPEYTASPEAEERFKREITVARRVTHGNVIRIHDTGIAAGSRFISMAFVDGEDLATILRLRPPAFDTAIDILTQVCDGLRAAHEAGIVHRDLKPANIMIDRSGRAYIMDFGLAYGVGSAALSAPGVVLGTPDYMSPEQARGEPADHRSDIYAFGVILFQILTGQLPFQGDTAMSRLSARLHGAIPDIASIRPDLPLWVTDVARRCLAVNPSDRFQSAETLRQALAAAPTERWGIGQPHFVKRALFLVGALVILMMVVGGVLRWDAGRELTAPPRPLITLAALPLYNASGDAGVDWFGRAVADVVLTRLSAADVVRTVAPDRVAGVLNDLRVGPSNLNGSDTAARIREFTGAQLVLTGEYTRAGDQIHVETTLRQADEGSPIRLPTQSASLEDVEAVAEKLADALSASLGRPQRPRDPAPAVHSGAVTRLYREGIELNREGKYKEAVQRLTEATTADDRYAEAWAALATSYVGLRQDREATNAARRAVEFVSGLPPRQRFRILALRATIEHDNVQAIDAYEQWLKAAPEDTEARFALAILHESVGAYGPSRRELAAVLERDPQNVVSPTLKKRRNLDSWSTDGRAAPVTGRLGASSG